MWPLSATNHCPPPAVMTGTVLAVLAVLWGSQHRRWLACPRPADESLPSVGRPAPTRVIEMARVACPASGLPVLWPSLLSLPCSSLLNVGPGLAMGLARPAEARRSAGGSTLQRSSDPEDGRGPEERRSRRAKARTRKPSRPSADKQLGSVTNCPCDGHYWQTGRAGRARAEPARLSNLSLDYGCPHFYLRKQ